MESLVAGHIPEKAYAEQWDAAGLHGEVAKIFAVDLPIVDWTKEEGIADEEVRERILKVVEARAAERTANFGVDVTRYVEKAILLQTLDTNWREHIVNLDHLRQYVGLRGYGQRDPLNEYKSEAFELFEALLAKLRSEVVEQLMHVQIQTGEPPPEIAPRPLPVMQASHIDPLTGEDEMAPLPAFTRMPVGPVDPEQARDLGEGSAQCALSLRIGTQIQTLSRRAGLAIRDCVPWREISRAWTAPIAHRSGRLIPPGLWQS